MLLGREKSPPDFVYSLDHKGGSARHYGVTFKNLHPWGVNRDRKFANRTKFRYTTIELKLAFISAKVQKSLVILIRVKSSIHNSIYLNLTLPVLVILRLDRRNHEYMMILCNTRFSGYCGQAAG